MEDESATSGSAGHPVAPRIAELFPNVLEVLGAGASSHEAMPASEPAGRLLAAHPAFGSVARWPAGEVARPVRDWLGMCARILDDSVLAPAGEHGVDLGLTLLALARLDPAVDRGLRDAGVRAAIEQELRISSSEVFVPWARPATATQFIELDPLDHPDEVWRCAFSADGRLLATAGNDGTARLWDVASARPHGDPLARDGEWVWFCAFSPDGRLLATASGDGTARLWDVASARPHGDLFAGHADWVWDCAFSSDGRLLATVSRDGTAQLWDVASKSPHGDLLAGHTGWARHCAFSPDGRLLATVGDDGTARLWDVASARRHGDPLVGHRALVSHCAFSPDGRLLATASGDGTARLWDVASARPHGDPLTGHADWVRHCAFSPDGRLLATASRDGTAQLWDVASARPHGDPLTGHAGWVRHCAFSPDGRLLATASDDGTARLWDVASARPHGDRLTGHTDGVTYCAFSPDGRLLATAGRDATARLWEGVDTSLAMASPVSDGTDGPDLLDLSGDADALANVLAATTTQPPLSVGLFGDWGSGKTFLIHEVIRRTDGLARRARRSPPDTRAHCQFIRNIVFNAWHYADVSLWASLAAHTFEQLADPAAAVGVSEDVARRQTARLHEQLASQSALREDLERVHVQAHQLAARRQLARWLWGLLGGDQRTIDELRTQNSAARRWSVLLHNRRAVLATACTFVGALAVAAVVVRGAGASGLGQALGAAGAALAASVAWVGATAERLTRLARTAGPGASDLHVADLDAQLHQARERERALRDELADLATGRRLTRYAAERHAADDYRAQLGVVSQIRRDFLRMSDILRAQAETLASAPPRAPGSARTREADPPGRMQRIRRILAGPDRSSPVPAPATQAPRDAAAEGAEVPPIDRIVLYIDDLDRCAPRRVVEVLEAVHLLLAIPLFVVVVAVDPRWLLQSLRLHYSELLAGDLEPSPQTDGDGAAVRSLPVDRVPPDALPDFGQWRSTPLHYLEKIIQVPLALPPITEGGVNRLVASLLPVATPATEGASAGAATGDVGPRSLASASPSDDGAPVGGPPTAASRARGAPAAPPTISVRLLQLTEAEQSYAMKVAGALRTPRAVKKFTNIYRLLRARLDVSSGELERFLRDDGRDTPEYQAVLTMLVVLINHPDEAPQFLLGLGDLRSGAGPDTRDWLEYIKTLRDRGGTWQELAEFLAAAQAASGVPQPTREPFRRWASTASRYSFTTGAQVFAGRR